MKLKSEPEIPKVGNASRIISLKSKVMMSRQATTAEDMNTTKSLAVDLVDHSELIDEWLDEKDSRKEKFREKYRKIWAEHQVKKQSTEEQKSIMIVEKSIMDQTIPIESKPDVESAPQALNKKESLIIIEENLEKPAVKEKKAKVEID